MHVEFGGKPSWMAAGSILGNDLTITLAGPLDHSSPLGVAQKTFKISSNNRLDETTPGIGCSYVRQ